MDTAGDTERINQVCETAQRGLAEQDHRGTQDVVICQEIAKRA
jgi:hypothetical protein